MTMSGKCGREHPGRKWSNVRMRVPGNEMGSGDDESESEARNRDNYRP